MGRESPSVSVSSSKALSNSNSSEELKPMEPLEVSQDAAPAFEAKRTCSRRFTDFIVAHPWVGMGWPLVLTLFLSFLAFGGAVPREKNAQGGEFFAVGEVEVQGFYASQVKTVPDVYPEEQALSQRKASYDMTVYWTAQDGNMLTPQNLLRLYDEEQVVMGQASARGIQVTDYAKYCRMTPPSGATDWVTPAAELTNCDVHDSPLIVFFDLTYPSSRAQVAALTQQDINDAVAYYFDKLEAFPIVGFFVDTDFTVQNGVPISHNLRTKFNFGAPLRGFTRLDDQEDKQLSEHQDFMTQYLEYAEAGEAEGMDISVSSEATFGIEIGRLVSSDFVLAFVAGMSVGVFMIFQTRSFMLSAAGMFEIFISYPVALFVYHAILRIEYDTAMNQLALFVLLGIGADDVFVFTDAWKQSRHEPPAISHNLNARFHWAWIRATKAMLVTSLTTIAAFAMTALSPIPAISRFGIVAALMVAINYGLVISFFPAVVMLYQRKFEKLGWTCKPLKEFSDDFEGKITHTSPLDQPDADVSTYRSSERFFYNKFAPFLYRFRSWVLLVFIIILGVSVWGATLLEQPEQESEFVPDNSEAKKAQDLSRNEFQATTDDARTVVNDIFFGVNPAQPLDREGVDPNNKDKPGKILVDPQVEFEFTPVVQLSLVQLCEELKVMKSSNEEPFVSTGSLAMQCLPLAYSQYEIFHMCSTKELLFDGAADNAACTQACDDHSASNLTSVNYLESITANDVLSFPISCRAQSDTEVAQRLVEFADDPTFQTLKHNVGGLTRSPPDVTWVSLSMATGLELLLPKGEREYWFAEWQGLIDSINARTYTVQGQQYDAEDLKLHRGIQTSFLWANHVTLDKLLKATFLSILISYAVAVVCLLVSSGNVFVAMLASVAIAGIVTSITALLVATGGKLDFSTSICLTILVGLAVDYTVHLAHAYHESHITGRYNRARVSLFQMGISVFSGCLTSAISSFFLLFTVLDFFQIFGRIILITVLLAFLWASVGFMASLMIIGPDHHPIGDIVYIFGRLFGSTEKAKSPDHDKKLVSDAHTA